MRKVLAIIVMLSVILTGCGEKPISATDKIIEHYKTLSRTNNTATIRGEISELESLSNDTSLTLNEQMFAKYTYNIACGVVKLDLSGKGVSFFDFPEIEMLVNVIGAVAEGEFEIDQEMLEESKKFLKKVEDFLK